MPRWQRFLASKPTSQSRGNSWLAAMSAKSSTPTEAEPQEMFVGATVLLVVFPGGTRMATHTATYLSLQRT